MYKSLQIGFVGCPRFKSLVKFAEVVVEDFSEVDLHFFGHIVEANKLEFEPFQHKKNCHFHGYFENPSDLPKIYSQKPRTPDESDLKRTGLRDFWLQ